jgi:hypothetical protein
MCHIRYEECGAVGLEHWALEDIVTKRPLFRIRAVDCTKPPAHFLFDPTLKVVKGKHLVNKDGQINFTTPPSYFPKTARSVFGPSFAHQGLIFAESPLNVGLCVNRQTGVRFPESGSNAQHEALFKAQLKNFYSRENYLRQIATRYEFHIGEVTDMVELLFMHYKDAHPKKMLRTAATLEMKGEGSYIESLWLDKIGYKIKKDEWAKPGGKLPRAIGDLGIRASLQGAWITHKLKTAQYNCPIDYGGGQIVFCKEPRTAMLQSVFNNLISPPGRFYFVYFSDDSCLAVRREDGSVDRYNLDIKSCDASHGPGLFRAMREVTPKPLQSGVDRLIKQLTLNYRVYNPSLREEFVEFKSARARLYSGSTLTTTVNNVACLLIALNIADTKQINKDSLETAAAAAGYLLTGTDRLENIEDLQFLKHSPVMDIHGVYRPVLNLGVLLRASGVCKGDLPGSGLVKVRAEQFQKALLQGMYPRTSIPCVDGMKKTVALATSSRVMEAAVRKDLMYKVGVETGDVHYFTDHEVFKRYRLTESEGLRLSDVMSKISFEQSWACAATNKILLEDYGLRAKFG